MLLSKGAWVRCQALPSSTSSHYDTNAAGLIPIYECASSSHSPAPVAEQQEPSLLSSLILSNWVWGHHTPCATKMQFFCPCSWIAGFIYLHMDKAIKHTLRNQNHTSHFTCNAFFQLFWNNRKTHFSQNLKTEWKKMEKGLYFGRIFPSCSL